MMKMKIKKNWIFSLSNFQCSVVRFEIDDAQRWNVECRITSSIRSRTEWSKSFFSSVLREREQNIVRGFSYSLAIFMYGIYTTHSRPKEKKRERSAGCYVYGLRYSYVFYLFFVSKRKTLLRKMPVCFCIPLYFSPWFVSLTYV